MRPLCAKTWKSESTVPGKKSRLPQIGTSAEMSRGLPSRRLIGCHALIVQIVIGLLQASLKDLNLLRKSKFTKGNLLNELSMSNHTDLDPLCTQSEIKCKWTLSWYLRISGRSKPPIEEGRVKVESLIPFFFLAQIKELNQLLNFLMILCVKLFRIIWMGWSNPGRIFIFRREIQPIQEMGRTFHLSKSIWMCSKSRIKFWRGNIYTQVYQSFRRPSDRKRG